MRAFLSVGLNCVDIVSFLPKFPLEDSDQRCTKQSWERGGNASNNASVLARLGGKVEFFGTLADDYLLNFFQEDMKAYGIACANCPILACAQTPASVVICSEETGSRTIVHNNGNLPELTVEQFKERIELSLYNWAHFEGRNEGNLEGILKSIQEYNEQVLEVDTKTNKAESQDNDQPNYKRKTLPVSVEVEKRRENLGLLLQYADITFIGKDFAEMKGATDCRHAAQIFAQLLPKGVLVICPWGDQGAAFCIAGQPQDKIVKVEASPPLKILDSLGAGDTFVATVIYALSNNLDIEASVGLGCKVAGAKLGLFGFRDIREAVQDIPEIKLLSG